MGERHHGRPPSYPTVVTTTNNFTSTDGGVNISTNVANNGGNDNSGDAIRGSQRMNNNSSNMSLETAMKLYELDKDPVASLKECRRIWGYEQGDAKGFRTTSEGEGTTSTADERTKKSKSGADVDNVKSVINSYELPLSRQHNQAVLEHLSMLRSRRRRRPRPPSHSVDLASNATPHDTPMASKNDAASKIMAQYENGDEGQLTGGVEEVVEVWRKVYLAC